MLSYLQIKVFIKITSMKTMSTPRYATINVATLVLLIFGMFCYYLSLVFSPTFHIYQFFKSAATEYLLWTVDLCTGNLYNSGSLIKKGCPFRKKHWNIRHTFHSSCLSFQLYFLFAMFYVRICLMAVYWIDYQHLDEFSIRFSEINQKHLWNIWSED